MILKVDELEVIWWGLIVMNERILLSRFKEVARQRKQSIVVSHATPFGNTDLEQRDELKYHLKKISWFPPSNIQNVKASLLSNS